jgi:hypothetical protein
MRSATARSMGAMVAQVLHTGNWQAVTAASCAPRSSQHRASRCGLGRGETGTYWNWARLLGRVFNLDSDLSLVPTWPTQHYCHYDPGVGDYTYPVLSPSGIRSTSHCTSPLSPRNIRLGRLTPRHGAWSLRQHARSEGVSHTSEPLQSRLILPLSAFQNRPSRDLHPKAPRRRSPLTSCNACPAPA